MHVASQLEHPMNARPPLDADLRYAILSVWQRQSFCPAWRVAQMKRFAAVARRLQATSSLCHRAMATTVRRVSGEFSVGLAAFCVALLGWPDHDFPMRCMLGNVVFGHIKNTGLWRPQVRAAKTTPNQLARSNDEYNTELAATRSAGRGNDIIYSKTLEEVRQGIASGPWSKAELDRRFGAGGWRGIPRFPRHRVDDDSWRPIDDGSRSGHNDATSADETIFTHSPDEPVFISHEFYNFENIEKCMQEDECLEPLGVLCGGCQDEKKAFRQVPIHPDHIAYNIVAIFNPSSGCTVFFIVFGSLFGFFLSVFNFNPLSCPYLRRGAPGLWRGCLTLL